MAARATVGRRDVEGPSSLELGVRSERALDGSVAALDSIFGAGSYRTGTGAEVASCATARLMKSDGVPWAKAMRPAGISAAAARQITTKPAAAPVSSDRRLAMQTPNATVRIHPRRKAEHYRINCRQ